MSDRRWAKIDDYFSNLLLTHDPVLNEVIERSARAGLPPHNVAPNQGKLLHLLATIQGATSILEIGTLGGYSTIWLAHALPEGGKLVTLEFDLVAAEVAHASFELAGLSAKIELMQGPALDSLPALINHPAAPFDLIFIDADKKNNVHYFVWALNLARPGTLIVADNVVRAGEVLDPTSLDPSVAGIRAFTEAVAADPG